MPRKMTGMDLFSAVEISRLNAASMVKATRSMVNLLRMVNDNNAFFRVSLHG